MQENKAKLPESVATAPRPTLKTIAYMTGLGVTTVSRALHDAPDIGQATKERVRLVAKQIGYRPNRAGVRLRTGKTNVISLILSVETEVLGLTSHLVYGISEFLAGSPYHLIVTPYNMQSDPLDPVRYIVETGSADGIIFSRTEPQDPRVRYLHQRGFPFATHGRTEMEIEHPYFDFDNGRYRRGGGRAAGGAGAQAAGVAGAAGAPDLCRHMTAGFQRAIERHDLIDVPIRTVTTDSSYEAIQAEIGRLMASRNRPDGIVCGSASAAIAAIGAAEGQGLRDRARLRRRGEGVLQHDAQVPQRDRSGARGLPPRRHGPGRGGAAHDRRRAGAELQTLDVPEA